MVLKLPSFPRGSLPLLAELFVLLASLCHSAAQRTLSSWHLDVPHIPSSCPLIANVPLWFLRQHEGPAAAKSLQSCPTLYNPIDGSPADSPVPGILQARALEWVAISFSNA